MPPAPTRGDDPSSGSTPHPEHHKLLLVPDDLPPEEQEKVRWIFRIGVGVMVASYVVYPIWGAIALLPMTAETKATSALVAWAVSWTAFTVGATLAGREGVILVTTFLKRTKGT